MFIVPVLSIIAKLLPDEFCIIKAPPAARFTVCELVILNAVDCSHGIVFAHVELTFIVYAPAVEGAVKV